MSCRWLRSKRIRPFHFYYVMLCADCRRLPTRVAIWSCETKSHSHGPTGFPITWIAALFFFFPFIHFLQFFNNFFFFFFLAILIPHKKTTILSGQVMVGFFLSFLYKFIIFSSLHKACHMDSYDKNYGFFFFFLRKKCKIDPLTFIVFHFSLLTFSFVNSVL